MSRVQGREQPAATATPGPPPPVLYGDALFLLIAESRRPTRAESLVFFLGLASVISLVFVTSDLMNSRQLRPSPVIAFIASASWLWVLVRRQRLVVANIAEEARLAAETRDPPTTVIDKETRRRLLDYFVFHPQEESKGEISSGSSNSSNIVNKSAGGSVAAHSNGRKNSQHEDGDAIGSSGRGTRLPKGVRGMLALLPTLNPPVTSPSPSDITSPPPVSGLRQLPMGTGQDVGGTETHGESNSAGDCEEGCQAATFAPACGNGDSSSRGGGGGSEKSHGGEPGEAASSPAVDATKSTEERAAAAGGAGGTKADREEYAAGSCIICFGDYVFGEELCRLGCRHIYHSKCVDEWLDGPDHGWCPLCKADVVAAAASARGVIGAISSSNTSSAGQGGREWRRQRSGNLQPSDNAV